MVDHHRHQHRHRVQTCTSRGVFLPMVARYQKCSNGTEVQDPHPGVWGAVPSCGNRHSLTGMCEESTLQWDLGGSVVRPELGVQRKGFSFAVVSWCCIVRVSCGMNSSQWV